MTHFFLKIADKRNGSQLAAEGDEEVGIPLGQLKQLSMQVLATDHAEPRSYLKAIYLVLKSYDAEYSYQLFSETLGLGSRNIHGIIAGKRPLTKKTGEKIALRLGLVGVQKKYFLAMVEEQRAKSRIDRDVAFSSRLELKAKVLPTELDRAKLAFFEHWYHAVILEMLRLSQCDGSAQWIHEHIVPSVPKNTIEESLELLKSLGYVMPQHATGKLVPTDATISTGNEVHGLALQNYHRQMLGLSLDALDQLPREKRDISATTITVSKKVADQLKDEIIALRKKFLQLSAEDTEADQVYQLNIQLFSMGKKKEK